MARLSRNYIVLRNSPDWLSYDHDQSRSFCARFALPENTIIDFMSIWDAALDIDYCHFRHALKKISFANFKEVHRSIFLENREFRAIDLRPDDLVAFVDDDDWLSPELFIRLRDVSRMTDGAKWGSIRVGPVFSQSPQTTTHGVFHARPIDRVLYTNNYAATGRALMRLGMESLFEHNHAQQQFDGGRYRPETVPEYLSGANKHPCSTMAILFLLNFEPFRADPRAEIARFAEALAQAVPQANMRWINDPIQHARGLLNAALGRPLGTAARWLNT